MVLALPFLSLGQADAGLAAWRRPDPRGQACASCHSPDGIELSAFGFGREDVLRRATRHLPRTEGEAIIDLLRRRGASSDALRDRPLQPGGDVLPGVSAGTRDLAFLRSLSRAVPSLADGRVESMAAARRARDEVRRVDLASLRIGIGFNRLSEDGFHGAAHRSVANWIPDVPVRGVSTEASDRYLADPSDENLRALDAGVRVQLANAATPGERLAASKYRSLLILQHRLRTGRFVAPVPRDLGLPDPNPFWSVAEFGRRYAEETEVASLGLPLEAAEAKSGGPAYRQQLRELRLPWFWLGWIRDPSLQHSGPDGETRRGDYFARYLWDDGPYPAHLTFMLTKKLVEQGCDPAAWTNARFPQAYEIAFSKLVLGEDLARLRLPAGEYRTRLERLTANAFRTALFLALGDVRAKGRAFHPESQLNQVGIVAGWLQGHDPRPVDGPLVAELRGRLEAAKPYRL